MDAHAQLKVEAVKKDEQREMTAQIQAMGISNISFLCHQSALFP